MESCRILCACEKRNRAFLSVYTQTIVAPVITTLLFYAVFALAFGGLDREIHGVPYLVFLAPGLVMMAMVQNAFANTSSSLIIAKVQGNIVDVLLPPLSPLELTLGYISGGVARGMAVACASLVAMSIFVHFDFFNFLIMFVFAFLGTTMLAALGVAGGIWSEKFDHIAAVTNFIITPFSFLSGTFYSLESLPDLWQRIALFNPFFYMIDGFRFGVIGQADSSIFVGILFLSLVDAALMALCFFMFRSGYKLRG